MLGFRTCTSQGVLKVLSSRKTSRKIRAVECPFGGSKRETSPVAPKWANHVKSWLNGLFKLINATFHLLESTLPDLRGGRGSIFCAFNMYGILVFLSVD
mgnify:CR=1 FL=1